MVRQVTEYDTGLKIYREPRRDIRDNPSETIIDIVAVHGLGAHPDDTWTKNRAASGEPQWVNWLEEEDMLPAEVPNARIMRYGFKSNWFGPHAIKQSVRTVAERLLFALRRARRECVDRPLIFISHSFGGLVVLKAVCDAYHDKDDWPGMADAIRGLIFFGTPFRGADGLSQSEMLQAAAREYDEDHVQQETIYILDPGNELLQDLVDQFQKRVWGKLRQARIACFYELQASELGGIVGNEKRNAFAVNERSGCLDLSDRVKKYPLERTHFNMNKFGRPTEEDYLLAIEVLTKILEDANILNKQSNSVATNDGTRIDRPYTFATSFEPPWNPINWDGILKQQPNAIGTLDDLEDIYIALIGDCKADKVFFVSACRYGGFYREPSAPNFHVEEHVFSHQGKRVHLIEMPEFDNRLLFGSATLLEILNWLMIAYARGIQLSALIFLHNNDDSDGERFALNGRMLWRLCGSRFLPRVFLTVRSNFPQTLEDTGQHWKPEVDRGCKIVYFSPSRQGVLDIIDHIMQLEQAPMDLEIQREMASMRKSPNEVLKSTFERLMDMEGQFRKQAEEFDEWHGEI